MFYFRFLFAVRPISSVDVDNKVRRLAVDETVFFPPLRFRVHRKRVQLVGRSRRSACVTARARVRLSAKLPVESVALAAPQFFRWNRNSAARQRANVVRWSTRVFSRVLSLPPLGTSVLEPNLYKPTVLAF